MIIFILAMILGGLITYGGVTFYQNVLQPKYAPRFYIEYSPRSYGSYHIRDNDAHFKGIIEHCKTYEDAVIRRQQLEQEARQVKQTMKELNK